MRRIENPYAAMVAAGFALAAVGMAAVGQWLLAVVWGCLSPYWALQMGKPVPARSLLGRWRARRPDRPSPKHRRALPVVLGVIVAFGVVVVVSNLTSAIPAMDGPFVAYFGTFAAGLCVPVLWTLRR